jgi:hypothetical protein
MAPWQGRAVLSRAKSLPDPAAIAIDRIERHSAYREALSELEALEKRLAETELRRSKARARILGAKPRRNAIERARDLVGGGRIEPSNPAGEFAATREEEAVLREAIATASARLDSVSREISYEISKKFKGAHDAALIAVLRALDDLAAALDTAAAVRARLRAAGYQPSPILLPELAPENTGLLGSSNAIGASPAWYFKKALEQRGVL